MNKEECCEFEELMLKLIEPYKSSIEETDFNGDETLCCWLHSEGEVILTIHIEGGWIYLDVEEYDYRERGESNEPDTTSLLDGKSWELSKPGTIKAFHKEIDGFIRTFHKECLENLDARARVYKESIKERESCANQ